MEEAEVRYDSDCGCGCDCDDDDECSCQYDRECDEKCECEVNYCVRTRLIGVGVVGFRPYPTNGLTERVDAIRNI